MASKRQQTMAKRLREQAVKERREAKQQKRLAAREAALEGQAPVTPDEATPEEEASESG